MKAAQLKKIGSIEICDLETPSCGSGDVMVDVKACSLCPTDLKMLSYGHRDLVLPRVLGHEVSGIVSQLGEEVEGLKPGDRVQVAPGVPCGKCYYCRSGHDNMCDSMRIIGFHLNGGLSENLLVPLEGVKAGIVNPIPEGISFEQACFAEPIACCLNALRAGRFTASDRVAVFGAGPIGCLLIQLLKYKGASKIFLIEKDEARLDFALQCGADYLLLWSKDDVFSIIKEVDLVISACNDPLIPEQAVKLLAKRGRIVFFSGLKGVDKVSVDYSAVHYKELMIKGAYGCTARQNQQALDLLAQGAVKVKSLITHRFCLDEIDKGFQVLKNKQGMKIVSTMKEE